MAPDCGHNEIIEHRHQVHVVLHPALDVLQHALRDVEAFHVDHNLTDCFLFVDLGVCDQELLLFQLPVRHRRIGNLRMRRVEAFVRVFDEARLRPNCVVHLCDGLEDHAAELALRGSVNSADQPQELDRKARDLLRQLRDCQSLPKKSEHLSSPGLIRIIQSQSHVQQLLDNELLLHGALLVLVTASSFAFAQQLDELDGISLNVEAEPRNLRHLFFDGIVPSVVVLSTEVVQTSDHEDALGRERVPEGLVKVGCLSVVWSPLPELPQRVVRGAGLVA